MKRSEKRGSFLPSLEVSGSCATPGVNGESDSSLHAEGSAASLSDLLCDLAECFARAGTYRLGEPRCTCGGRGICSACVIADLKRVMPRG